MPDVTTWSGLSETRIPAEWKVRFYARARVSATFRLLLAMTDPSAHAPLLATDLTTTFPCLLDAHDKAPICQQLGLGLASHIVLGRNVGIS
jgi:hypothetical protein